jgi:hypothetical protein
LGFKKQKTLWWNKAMCFWSNKVKANLWKNSVFDISKRK